VLEIGQTDVPLRNDPPKTLTLTDPKIDVVTSENSPLVLTLSVVRAYHTLVLIEIVWMLTNPDVKTPYPPGVGRAEMLLGVGVEEAVTEEVKVVEPERVMEAELLLVEEEVGDEVGEGVCVGVAVTELVNVIEGVLEGDKELDGVFEGLVPSPTRMLQVVFGAKMPVEDGTWPNTPR
jgi:hypothetical protein